MKKFYFFIALLSGINAFGQWTGDTSVNTQVANSQGEYIEAIGTSDGKTYVVFWAPVGAPINYELRLQLIDVDGNKLFGENGMLISDDIPMGTYTVLSSVVTDANDNLYIGATGTGSDNPAFAFKIDTNGNKLWGENGINVGTGNVVTILPLSSGEAIVSWFAVPQILMQKYDAGGTAVWDSPKMVENGSSATVPANLFELSDGGFVMIFHSVLSAIYSNLFAQRFDVNGDPQWTSAVQISDKTTTFNGVYSGVQDGDVVYYGYMASSGTRFDSFLQRIDADGTLPWGMNGMDFDTNETNYEMYTEIAFEPGSQYVWSICSYSDPSQANRGEYVQKFDKVTGQRQFTDTAKELFPIGSENVHAGKLQLIDDEPFFLLKSGIDNGASPVTLHAIKLDGQGDFAWTDEMLPVATFSASKSRVHFTKPVNGQSVAVFVEQKSTDSEPRIYAQNLVDPTFSIVDFQDEEFSVFYENPVQNSLSITSEFAVETISVFDLLGRKIYGEKLIAKKRIEIHARSWNSGTYIVQLKTVSGSVKNFKIVKR